MKKKYRLIPENHIDFLGCRLYQIEAVRDFDHIKKGTLGGYIQSEENLSHEGNCWVDANSRVLDHAQVKEDAAVRSSIISLNAVIKGTSAVMDSNIYGCAVLSGNSFVSESYISGNVTVDSSRILSCELRDYVKVNKGVKLTKVRAWDRVEFRKGVKITIEAELGGDLIIYDDWDVLSFKLPGNDIPKLMTYTKRNKKWRIGYFYGTLDEFKRTPEYEHTDFIDKLDELAEYMCIGYMYK